MEIYEERPDEESIGNLLTSLAKAVGVSREDARYLMSLNTMSKDMYDVNDDRIDILYKDGSLHDITEASEIMNIELLSKKIRKYFLCYQKT